MGWFKKALSGLIRKAVKIVDYVFSKPATVLLPPPAGKNATREEIERMKKKEEKRKEKAKKAKAKNDLKLVIDGAKIQCMLCSSPIGTLLVTTDTPTLQGKKIATVKDKGKSNLVFTGTCMKSPNAASPCASVIQVGEWKDTGSFNVQGQPPLLQKSTIKCMFGNTDIKIAYCGQKSPFAYDLSQDEQSVVKEKADLTLSLFFDGTRNNMKNTEAREEYFKLHGKSPFENEKWKASANKTKAGYYERIGNKKDDSYENGYSNVALLSKYYIKELSDAENLDDFAYVEGIATGNKQTDAYVKDSTLGYALGQGETGVEAKVEKGCQFAAKKIDKLIPKAKKTECIVINVFGFSRGAAAARSFLNEISQPGRPARIQTYASSNGMGRTVNIPAVPKYGILGKELQKMNIDLTDTRIIIRFAGLFDTVASHGLVKSNDTKSLGLDAVRNAKKILHLVAADEHRYFFPLVNINSAGSNEKYFPGVHSDIGGSYVDNAPENKKGLAVGLSAVVEAKHRKLIREGWYKKEQLTVFKPEEERHWYDPVGNIADAVKEELFQHLSGARKSIPVAYSYIPLYIMCDYAMQKGIWIRFKDASMKSTHSLKEHSKLDPIKKRLYQIVFENAPPLKFYSRKEIEKQVGTLHPNSRMKEHYGQLITSILEQLEDLEPDAGKPIKLESFITDPELKRRIEDHNMLLWLRNEYLHWSADWLAIGFNPTQSGKRKIYNG